jgi:PAS domain S-box-containing protein
LESYAIFIYDDQGNPIQLIGAIKDITEIEELIEERERILESINDYFYVLDLQMNFKYCNQAFANRYLEGNREKVIGKNIYEMFPFLKQSVLAEHLSNAINSGISDHFDLYLDVEELAPVWIEEHIYPFENGLSVLFRDISDRKVAEQNLQKLNAALQIKTQELTNSNTELERFAYVASHDLQEPLRMVSSFMQLFEKKYERLVDETGKKYIQFAVDGAERMKLLIRDLLQYSRAGSGSLEIKQVNMNVVLKEVLLLFKNEIYQVDAEIKYGNLPIIQAGKSAMIQLMQNLIGNALKYRREEKPVVEISGVETDQEWIIHIKDNGIGIEPRYFEKIFIVFQRLHNKNEYGGTGIGLSVCKKIVERYKGRIWVASEPGKGSVFSFSIPKKK